jgi:hypothetical protein
LPPNNWKKGGESGLKDPLADITACRRDVERFQQLGINTVRVYTIDNSAKHDDCMKLLADAGIYVSIDVSWSKYSLNRKDPDAMRRSYNDVYLQSVFATIDSFAKYDNLLLFFAANEVISETETWSAPYIKAQIRDMKQYITARNYRKIPVGYAATDVQDTHYEIATYLNCGPDNVRGDFIAFNDYSWCGPQAFSTSSWGEKTKLFSNFSAPMLYVLLCTSFSYKFLISSHSFSEYGCIKVQPRLFSDVAALYSSDMTSVYSGGLIYEYSWEGIIIDSSKAGFGIVDVNGNSTKERPDFTALQSAFKKTPIPLGNGGYQTINKASTCPGEGPHWKANASLPTIPQGAVKFMTQGAGPGPGFKSDPDGSQWKGTPSTGSWKLIQASGDDSKASSTVSTPVKSGALANSLPNLSFVLLGMGLLCKI